LFVFGLDRLSIDDFGVEDNVSDGCCLLFCC